MRVPVIPKHVQPDDAAKALLARIEQLIAQAEIHDFAMLAYLLDMAKSEAQRLAGIGRTS